MLGDAMADWLAYGLEDAYAEQPDMGVIRKHKTVSGLIKYQPKGDPADWAAAAKGILATEKPDAIVVMLGLNDRMAIREPIVEKPDSNRPTKRPTRRTPKPSRIQRNPARNRTAQPILPQSPRTRQSIPNCPRTSADNNDAPPATTPEKSARSPNGVYEFREERWVDLYTRKIDEMIRVLKSKGVPVLWVGLPAVRGAKATADMLFLDSLYREAAGKAGITYVDVWDGFVDEAGRFLQQGPDFEGQIRRLRSNDGVYFTKAGARKLAHYVEREITRLFAAPFRADCAADRTGNARRQCAAGQPAPRPLAGPIVPLVASSVGTDQLLGGPGSRPAAVDPLAARTLVKGEPLTPPPAAPMISPGRAAKSAANRPRAKSLRHPLRRPTPKPPRPHRRERRKKLVGTGPRDVEAAGATQTLVLVCALRDLEQQGRNFPPKTLFALSHLILHFFRTCLASMREGQRSSFEV